MGSAGFSPTQVDIVTIAIDGTIPYVAYRSTSDYKAKVMKFASGSWTDLNSSGLSGQFVDHLSLAVDAGTPYLAYVGTPSSTPYVMEYSSGAWAAVGSGIAPSYADYTSLAIYNHIPYLAFLDGGNSDKATVKKFESGIWSPVGLEGFSSGLPAWLSLAIDGAGKPYVAYADQNNGAKATVMKFNGTSWGLVGPGVVSIGLASLVSLAIDSTGNPYVAFQDGDNGSKATVMKFDGTAWSALGGAGFTANVPQEPSIKLYNDAPYLVFWETDGIYKGSLMQYDLSPTVTAIAAISYPDSFQIYIPSFEASGNAAITGYMITESATPPSAGAPGWTDKFKFYTVDALGTYTLYPWVKDSANRVSQVYGSPATVNVTSSYVTVTSSADSGPGSIREAIANTTPGGTIQFDSNRTIVVNSPLTIDQNLSIDGRNYNITLDGGNNTSIMQVNPGTTVTLDTLTIQNGAGRMYCGSGDTCGGGIRNSGILTLNNINFSVNYADKGGAIANLQNASLTVTDSTFSNNSATYDGGAIYTGGGQTDVTNSTFTNNNADKGGAVFNDSYSVVTFTGSTFSDNSASDGGAVFNDIAAKLSVFDSNLSHNNALFSAGAVFNQGTMDAQNLTLRSNQATQLGGAIFNAGLVTYAAGTMSNNEATQDGGAIYNQDSGTLHWTGTRREAMAARCSMTPTRLLTSAGAP